MARVDSMGINIAGIEAACRLVGVDDPFETASKVRELVSYLGEFEEKQKQNIKPEQSVIDALKMQR